MPGEPEPRSRDRGADQNEHRRDAARDRVDEADVRAPIRGREQQEVRELEHDGRDDPRDGGRLHIPGKDGDGREQDDPQDDGDSRCCAYVLRSGNEDVPAGVECRCAEREQERVDGHRVRIAPLDVQDLGRRYTEAWNSGDLAGSSPERLATSTSRTTNEAFASGVTLLRYAPN